MRNHQNHKEWRQMQARTLAVLLGVTVTLAGISVNAHHGWNAQFNENRPLVLRGTLSKIEMVNPHSWLWIDVKTPDGKVTTWGIEGGPPSGLVRNGVTKDSLKLGEDLVVHGYGARDGSNVLAGVKYERTDGKEFFMANNGPEAVAQARGNLK
jgi:hypothetical protein